MKNINLKLLMKRIFMKAYAVQTENPTTGVKTTKILYGFDVVQALNKRPKGHGLVSVRRV